MLRSLTLPVLFRALNIQCIYGGPYEESDFVKPARPATPY
jgi:hypothetical protein